MTTTTILILGYFFINTLIAGTMVGDPRCFKEEQKDSGTLTALWVLFLFFLFGGPGYVLHFLDKKFNKK